MPTVQAHPLRCSSMGSLGGGQHHVDLRSEPGQEPSANSRLRRSCKNPYAMPECMRVSPRQRVRDIATASSRNELRQSRTTDAETASPRRVSCSGFTAGIGADHPALCRFRDRRSQSQPRYRRVSSSFAPIPSAGGRRRGGPDLLCWPWHRGQRGQLAHSDRCRAQSHRDLEYEAIRLDLALEALAGARLRILILDECRNNPFGHRWQGAHAPLFYKGNALSCGCSTK